MSVSPVDRMYFLNLNGNKRSLAANLKRPEGRDLILRMAPNFHVVAENLAPGAMESLGLGYEAGKAAHPAVIFASVKGFGSSGPYAHYRSYDMVAQAVGGSMSITGTQETVPFVPAPPMATPAPGCSSVSASSPPMCAC